MDRLSEVAIYTDQDFGAQGALFVGATELEMFAREDLASKDSVVVFLLNYSDVGCVATGIFQREEVHFAVAFAAAAASRGLVAAVIITATVTWWLTATIDGAELAAAQAGTV